MTTLRTAVRVQPAAWLCLPMAILAAWYATLLHSAPGYGVAATASASGTLPFVGAFVAGCSAWEGARLRRAAIWRGAWVRPGWVVATGALALPVAGGMLALAAAVVASLAKAGSVSPDVAIVALAVLDLIVMASVGFLLGLRLPSALAVPVAIVLPVLYLAFVPAMYPVWLRHLTGMFRDCCGLSEALAPAAIVASLAASAGILGATAIGLATTWERPVPRWAAGAGVLTVAFAVAGVSASGLTYAPVTARDASVLACETAGETTVCLWPEHVGSAVLIGETVNDVRQRWAAAGIVSPLLVSEAGGVTTTTTLKVRLPDPLIRDGVILSLATGMLPTDPGCDAATTGAIANSYLQAWYAAAGGLAPASPQGLDMAGDDVNPSVLDVIDALWKAQPDARRTWVDRARATATSCEEIVPDLRVVP